jgi:hypothetical protein
MVNDIFTPFYYYKFHFNLPKIYLFLGFENILEALLIPWNAILILLAGFGAVLFIFSSCHIHEHSLSSFSRSKI